MIWSLSSNKRVKRNKSSANDTNFLITNHFTQVLLESYTSTNPCRNNSPLDTINYKSHFRIGFSSMCVTSQESTHWLYLVSLSLSQAFWRRASTILMALTKSFPWKSIQSLVQTPVNNNSGISKWQPTTSVGNHRTPIGID